MKTDEIRSIYLDFFKSKGHRIVPSSSLIPFDDPTLLFAGAGMNQFKAEFTGFVKNFKRACSSQKCLRTSDIDNVGKTPRHHTFFEMLGNFSFGDYFKKEAIEWSWEFLTQRMNLKQELLWISTYKGDDETDRIWNKNIGVPSSRIIQRGDKENFWPSNVIKEGPDGPCGPCSEIYFDQGTSEECNNPSCNIECSCGRYVEMWNLVFTQYNRLSKEGNGILEALPNKNIDTGMGLERIAAVVQSVSSNYEIDIIKPLIGMIKTYSKKNGNGQFDVSSKVIADHIRAVCFAVGDGVMPSNDGRGYVIRMLIRRAMRFANQIDIKKPFLYRMVPLIAEIMKQPYPELQQKRESISGIILAEEKRFIKTLEEGSALLNNYIEDTVKAGGKVLSGEVVFKLYDTCGFPVDLTETIAKEKNIHIDFEGFKLCMEQQKQASRKVSSMAGQIFATSLLSEKIKDKDIISSFVGYETLFSDSKIIGILKNQEWVRKEESEAEVEVILDRTPFYAESGGQVGDTGFLKTENSITEVYNTYKIADTILHRCRVKQGSIGIGQCVSSIVDKQRRLSIARNHTATHILRSILRQVLGSHVEQSGSYVGPDRLRFDFTHFEAIDDEDIDQIEKKVNQVILENIPLDIRTTTFEDAKEQGATTLFIEKYTEKVRLVSIQEVSKELCAGTHIGSTGQTGLFIILSETSVAGGIRRIEAITGEEAYNFVKEKQKKLSEISKVLNTQEQRIIPAIEKIQICLKDIEKENFLLKTRGTEDISDILQDSCKIQDTLVVVKNIKDANDKQLRAILDRIKSSVKSASVVLLSIKEDRVIIATAVSNDLTSKINAGRLANEVAKKVGGAGGGKPGLGQAGGKNIEKIDEAIAFAKEYLKATIISQREK